MHDREIDELLKRVEEEEDGNLSRRDLLKRGAALGAGLAAFSFAGSAAARSLGGAKPPSSGAAIPFADLLSEAKNEGTLNTIALPRNWANYGQMIDTFKRKYGLKVVEGAPEISSAEENQAIKSLKGQKRAPDVLDVGPSFAIDGKKQGLYQPYKNRQWGTIPPFMKDAGGYWVADYWGAIAFGSNLDVVSAAPKSWQDLTKSAYKGKVALNDDPRIAGAAFAGVFSAALANGGSLDNIGPGIDFFANLSKIGNFVPVNATTATVASGETPVTIDWDYLQIGYSKELKNIKWTVTVPSSGAYGSYYCQAINKWAPHPFAARLWQEFIYSVQGQLIWLKGYSHPARFPDLARKKLVPAALAAKLPPASSYDKIKFATPAQLEKAKATLTAEWGPKVLGRKTLATSSEAIDVVRPGSAEPGRRRRSLAWLGLVPFLFYSFAFLLLPSAAVLIGAFRNDQGQFTLSNISEIFQGQFLNAYKTSIQISLITALLGGLIGFLLAYSAIRPGTPKGVRLTLTTFSGVAANFAGVPLAFAFIATLGTLGLVTRFINDTLGYNLYDHGFSLFGLTGLSIVYLYFQIPLMILIIAPAIDGLRLEWREAAANLGASSRQYWRHVGVPLLLPSFLGAMVLLFGNAFSAYATAYALSLKVNLVPLVIGQVLSGNVLSDPHLGHALALGMIVVISFSMVVYALLQRRAARWMR